MLFCILQGLHVDFSKNYKFVPELCNWECGGFSDITNTNIAIKIRIMYSWGYTRLSFKKRKGKKLTFFKKLTSRPSKVYCGKFSWPYSCSWRPKHVPKFKVRRQICIFLKNRLSSYDFYWDFKVNGQIWKSHKNLSVDPRVDVVVIFSC